MVYFLLDQLLNMLIIMRFVSLHLSAPLLIMIQPSIRVRDGVHGS